MRRAGYFDRSPAVPCRAQACMASAQHDLQAQQGSCHAFHGPAHEPLFDEFQRSPGPSQAGSGARGFSKRENVADISSVESQLMICCIGSTMMENDLPCARFYNLNSHGSHANHA
ncbi:hypothetical protein MRB53_026463 [Persea americana]|uniref:Uncharacterized protein n=1 Tax=Persea americana TaxID=3435 RepID=A0ACC2LIA3_PERAE|nr:hypothetical protein MRB53_026463 [Persea americana]